MPLDSQLEGTEYLQNASPGFSTVSPVLTSSSGPSSPYPNTPPTHENNAIYPSEPLGYEDRFNQVEEACASIPASTQQLPIEPQQQLPQNQYYYPPPAFPQNVTPPFSQDFVDYSAQAGQNIGNSQFSQHNIQPEMVYLYPSDPLPALCCIDALPNENWNALPQSTTPEASTSTMPPPFAPFTMPTAESFQIGPSSFSHQPTVYSVSSNHTHAQMGKAEASASMIRCRWGNPTVQCTALVEATGPAVREHLRQFHEDVQNHRREGEATKMKCIWAGCPSRRLLNEDSVGRHICHTDGHILSDDLDGQVRAVGVKFHCEKCDGFYSRNDALQRHKKICKGSKTKTARG